MIEIVTLFLGLYHGVQPVELKVADAVATVEIRLDGVAVGTLSGPPWDLRVDLGPELEPHELIAIARGPRGDELGRARRWVNLELKEASEDSGVAATAIVLSLAAAVRLPPLEEMQRWFSAAGEPVEVLRVEQGPAEVVIVRDPAAQPYLDRTASYYFQFRLGCRHELAAATLADRETFVAACRTELLERDDARNAARTGIVWKQWNQAYGFGDDADMRLISPRAAPVSRIAKPAGIFNFTTERSAEEQGLLWHSAVVRPLQFNPRIADAVAVAGLEAHAARRRRAVVLLMVDHAMGSSRYPPSAVRRYLRSLQVPLYVWDFGIPDDLDRPATAPESDGREWGDVRDLTHPQLFGPQEIGVWMERLESATEEVRRELRRQRVVWLKGAYLPGRVELSEAAIGVRLAGSSITEQGVDG